jgi:hypothetical protein
VSAEGARRGWRGGVGREWRWRLGELGARWPGWAGAALGCEDVAFALAGAADGSPLEPADARAHVGRCLRCQAHLAQHRRLHRALGALAAEQIAAPGLPELLAALAGGPPGTRGSAQLARAQRNRKLAYASGVAATAGATGALLLAVRSRRARLRPAG